MAIFNIPLILANFTEKQRTIEIEAITFQSALDQLIVNFPQLRNRILDKDGNLFPHVTVFIDEEQWDKHKDNVLLNSKSRISLAVALSGG